MATSRPFAYNPTQQTEGVAQQFGDLAVGFPNQSYQNSPGGLKWWNGVDEDLAYIIGTSQPTGGVIAPDGNYSNVAFWKTNTFSNSQFIQLVNRLSGSNFTTREECTTWLYTNGYWTSRTQDKVDFIGGPFDGYFNYSSQFALLTTNGTVDTNFNIGTGFDGNVFAQTFQSDGKIIVGGGFLNYNGTARKYITRLNSNGTIDSTFNPDFGFDVSVLALGIQSDGKIVVGGAFTSYQGITKSRIARLNANASYDSTFSIGTGFSNYSSVYSLAIQSDGKIVIGGSFTTYQGVSNNSIIRLNSDGSIDYTFVTGTGFIGNVYSLILQSDGKIIVGGNFTSYNGSAKNRIIRLNTDGSIDSTFSIGTGFSSDVNSLGLQSDGKIVVGGAFGTYQGVTRSRIARLNTDGSYDSSFSIGTGFNTGGVKSLVIQSDEKIIAVGTFSAYNGVSAGRILRLNSNGILDSGFKSSTNNDVFSVAISPDQKTYIGGAFEIVLLRASNGAILIYNNGETVPTASFNIGDGFNGASVYAAAAQPDGKLILGGTFTTYQGTTRNKIIRLNNDSSIDSTFSIGTGFNFTVYALGIQSDGKIIIGGQFTTYQGTTRNRIVRLNNDGTVDTNFNIGTGFDNTVFAQIFQSDGKIIIGGQFTTYQGTTRNKIIRLNTDGSIDSTFSIGTGFDGIVNSLVIQSDGKIIVGGNFTTYQNVSRNYIARLNTDGSYDNTFSIGTGFNLPVYALGIQSDGKIIIGGNFTSYNGNTKNKIIRLNTDGTVDSNFSIGFGFNSTVLSIAVQSDGKIVAGGYFTSYNLVSKFAVVRLNTNGSIDTSFDVSLNASPLVLYPYTIVY